jgi:hypothetical protein
VRLKFQFLLSFFMVTLIMGSTYTALTVCNKSPRESYKLTGDFVTTTTEDALVVHLKRGTTFNETSTTTLTLFIDDDESDQQYETSLWSHATGPIAPGDNVSVQLADVPFTVTKYDYATVEWDAAFKDRPERCNLLVDEPHAEDYAEYDARIGTTG